MGGKGSGNFGHSGRPGERGGSGGGSRFSDPKSSGKELSPEDKKFMFDQAKIAGEKLYGKPETDDYGDSGLVFGDTDTVEHVNLKEIKKFSGDEEPEDYYDDDMGAEGGIVDDFEYQFNPSSGEGLS